MSADIALQRATAYLEDARDTSQDPAVRFEALDASRAALIDARRARAEPQALLPIFNAILDTASADRTHTVRVVVPQVVEELCMRDFRTFVPSATAHLFRSLQDDNVLVAKRAVRALTVVFRKLMGFVVSVGVGENTFPEARLSVWLQMQNKGVALINSPDEGIRKAACKLAEAVVLAFSYGGAASAEHFTLDYVAKKAPSSPLLDRKKLEEEGVHCVKAVAQLVQSSLDGAIVNVKPNATSDNSGLQPSSLMTAITVLSTLIRRRPKLLPITVPPFLSVIAAISGPIQNRSRAFLNLSEAQKASILAVMRISFSNVRAFNHTRSGPVGAQMTRAEADLVSYEREQEMRRKQQLQQQQQQQKRQLPPQLQQPQQPQSHPPQPRLQPQPPPQVVLGAQAALHQRPPKMEPTSFGPPGMDLSRDPSRNMPTAHRPRDPPRDPNQQRPPMGTIPQHPPLKRPRPPDANCPWPRLPPQEAMAVTSELVRNMRPQEVVNFIMTRLLLNIPPAHTIPGAVDPAVSDSSTANVAADEPIQKKQKRTRFGTKDAERSSQTTSAPKKVAVRRAAPPVVPVTFSPSATEQLITFCCRRILTREAPVNASGARPLRLLLLARILTTLARRGTTVAREFCDEACGYIVDSAKRNIPLALAWLHSLTVAEEFALLPEPSSAKDEMQIDETPHPEAVEAPKDILAADAVKMDVEIKSEEKDIKMAVSEGEKEIPLPTADDIKQVEGEPQKNTTGDVIEEEPKEKQPPSAEPKVNGAANLKDVPMSDTVSAPNAQVTDNSEDNDQPQQSNEMQTSANGTGKPEKDMEGTAQKEKVSTERESDDKASEQNASVTSVTQPLAKEDSMAIEQTVEQEELVDVPDEPVIIGEAYLRIFTKLFSLFKEQQNSEEHGLSEILTQAPVLPPKILDLVADLCKDPTTIKLGLQVLSEIVTERPGRDRQTCLATILSLTSDEDEVVRGPAIRLVTEKIFVEMTGEIPETVENHAVDFLDQAVDALSKEVNSANVGSLRRATLLPIALSGQKHGLVEAIGRAYVRCPKEGKLVIIERAEDLAKNVGMSSVPLQELIRGTLLASVKKTTEGEDLTENDEELALGLLRAILKEFGRPETELVQAALARYELCGNMEFVIAVLPGLTKEALVKHLGSIVEFVIHAPAQMSKVASGGDDGKAKDENKKTGGFKEVIGMIQRGRPVAVSPAELLMELHKLKCNAAVSVAIRACFELKAVYKQEAIAQAIQQLIELTTIPEMLMRTVHLAKIFHPELENYLTDTVMKRMIEKKVWNSKLLWEGFLRYCSEIKEKASVKLLLRLPVAQLSDALERKEALLSMFKELVSNTRNAKRIPAKYRKVIAAAIKKSSSGK